MTQDETLLDQMEALADIPLTLRAELDRTTVTFGEVLDLEAGSVIQLSRGTGENIDIYFENVLIGWGEVLMIDGALTLRLADLREPRALGLQRREAQPPQEHFAEEKSANGRP